MLYFFFAAAILSRFCIHVHACVTTIINNMQKEAVHGSDVSSIINTVCSSPPGLIL